jgi:hypothetical protein
LTLAALGRPPRTAEEDAVRLYLWNAADRRKAWEDVLWSLLNAPEFLYRR